MWDAAWPEGEEVLGISNEATVGDLVEAFFGYHWQTVIMGTKTISGFPARFVHELERALFCSYFNLWCQAEVVLGMVVRSHRNYCLHWQAVLSRYAQ